MILFRIEKVQLDVDIEETNNGHRHKLLLHDFKTFFFSICTICVFILFQCAPGVEYLLHSYPNYVSVESLPLTSLDQKVKQNVVNGEIRWCGHENKVVFQMKVRKQSLPSVD